MFNPVEKVFNRAIEICVARSQIDLRVVKRVGVRGVDEMLTGAE